MTEPRILVAGIGNIFLGDDAFGVEVVKRLAFTGLAGNVDVVDYGIRSLDLAYALMDGYDLAILVDAVGRGGAPGTLYVIEPEIDGDNGASIDAHSMNPVAVLQTVVALGGRPKRVLVVGCEPETLGDELHGAMGLSPTVEAAVEPAVALVRSLIMKTAHVPEAAVGAEPIYR